MALFKSENRKAIDCHAKNMNPLILYAFEWTVENLFAVPLGLKTESPHFHPFSNTDWYFEIEKKKDVYLCNGSGSYALVKAHVSVSDSDHKVFKELDTDVYLSEKSEKRLVFSDCENKLTKSSPIYISFEMKIYGLNMHKSAYIHKSLPKEEKFLDTFQSDLQSLRKSSRFSDVTLVTEGNTIQAHKNILSARSPVFAKMFEFPTTENNIYITDIPYNVLNLLMDFLYGDFPDLPDSETASSLYYAADKYQVLELRRACGQALLSMVTMEDASKLLHLADLHNDEELVQEVAEFIKFHFKSVSETDGWKDMLGTNTKAAMVVFNHLSRDFSQ